MRRAVGDSGQGRTFTASLSMNALAAFISTAVDPLYIAREKAEARASACDREWIASVCRVSRLGASFFAGTNFFFRRRWLLDQT